MGTSKGSKSKSVSHIPVRKRKLQLGSSGPLKRIDNTLNQLKTLKVKIKAELTQQISSPKRISASIPADDEELDLSDESKFKDQLIELSRSTQSLKKQVNDLSAQNSMLQNRLLKEQEKGKLIPKVTSIVPTSLEVRVYLFDYNRPTFIYDTNFKKV
jgi:hypothetical protein